MVDAAQKQDELKALADIVRKLEAMTEAERHRTLVYITDRYGFHTDMIKYSDGGGTIAVATAPKPTLRGA